MNEKNAWDVLLHVLIKQEPEESLHWKSGRVTTVSLPLYRLLVDRKPELAQHLNYRPHRPFTPHLGSCQFSQRISTWIWRSSHGFAFPSLHLKQ